MTLPAAVNDALLEMMGECRHDYYPIPNADTPYERGRCWERLGCRKCEENDKPLIFGEDESAWGPVRYRDGRVEAPNVGDGHQVSLGEMVQLWAKMHPDKPRVIKLVDRAPGELFASVWAGWDDGLEEHEVVSAQSPMMSDTVELALARALFAAQGVEVS